MCAYSEQKRIEKKSLCARTEKKTELAKIPVKSKSNNAMSRPVAIPLSMLAEYSGRRH